MGDLLVMLPIEQLVRIDRGLIEKYHPKFRAEKKGAPEAAAPRG